MQRVLGLSCHPGKLCLMLWFSVVVKSWSGNELPLTLDDIICDSCHAKRIAKFTRVPH